MSTPETPSPPIDPDRTRGAAAFHEVQQSAEFGELRSRFRRFAFPLSIAFLVWYFLYVLLSTYAVDFMNTKVFGLVNLGILLGLLQFVSTFTITWLYIRHANRNLDPIAAKLRADLEGRV
jgi:uncharacterized membrane protein (DUF485 family)